MSVKTVGSISVGDIEFSLNDMLRDFLGDEGREPNCSRFLVTNYSFSDSKSEQYPASFGVKLESKNNFSEFDLSPNQIVKCLETLFSGYAESDYLKFKTARVEYHYPQYEESGSIFMHCVICNESIPRPGHNDLVRTVDSTLSW
jgi:hypothetical protein